MSNARKGRDLEWHVRDLFEADGWAVIRGAGSKGEVALVNGEKYKADLVATKCTDRNKREVWIVVMQTKVEKR